MRQKTALMIVIILGFGLIGTGFSAFYEQNELVGEGSDMHILKTTYGFPMRWYGYSQQQAFSANPIPKFYWFSLESLVLDTAFWVVISFFACFAIMKSVNTLRKTRTSKNLSVINI
jgi:disulfide bond formation protein DsbB